MSKEFDFKASVAKWNQNIKDGQIEFVRNQLMSLSKSVLIVVPRQHACDMAGIARRVHLHILSLKWLGPHILFDQLVAKDTTADEIFHYTSALMRNGSFAEARMILAQKAQNNHPQILLARAHLEIFQWNYAEATSILKKYILSSGLNPYSKRIGCLNLCAAYVAEHDWEMAAPLLYELRSVTLQDQQWLIYANSSELLAQMFVQQGHYEKATQELRTAQKILKQTGGTYNFLVQKWLTIVEAMQAPTLKESQKLLDVLREASQKQSDFETLRESDLFYANLGRDKELFFKLYFGTRHKGYLRRIKRIYKPDFSIPKLWAHCFLSSNDPVDLGRPQINLATGQSTFPGLELHKNRLFLLCLRSLFSDMYSANVSQGMLMNALYPNEFFNPITSPSRLFQVVSRLRKQLRVNVVPIKIVLKAGFYSAIVTGPLDLVLFRHQEPNPKVDDLLESFLSQHPKPTFSSLEFSEHGHLSLRQAERILQRATQKKALKVNKSGRPYRYKAA